MKIIEVEARTPKLVEQLVTLWEGSVKATHLFLSSVEIATIKQYVPQGLEAVAHLVIAEEDGKPAAFMGIQERNLEMLFVDSQRLGQGLGKELITYGISKYGVDEVIVNEQNPKALGFYEHMGFAAYKISDTDEQGGPYPIVFMRLGKKM